MSDEPQFPAIPAIGELLDRKKRFVEKIHSVIKCGECKESFSRIFKPGDFILKKITDKECIKCKRKETLTIVEIYSEWIDPKKEQ